MRATFTQDQLDIEKTMRSLATSERGSARGCLESGWSAPAIDETLLRDFSVLGVPESAGGVGSGLIDLLVAIEVLGRCVVPSRFPAHAAAVQLAVGSGLDLTAPLEGGAWWTPAVDEPRVDGWRDLVSTAARPATKTLVPHAAEADTVVVLHGDGVALVSSPTVRLRESLDPGRPLSDVDLEPGADTRPAGSGAERATLVAAAELCGVGQGAIDLAAAHARSRTQFGRVIGSFQGVAFQLAEAAVARKAAWDLTLYAAWAVEHAPAGAALEVHTAKAAAGRAAVFAAERCIQVHGGMGITREADPHLFLRRALVLDAWLGSGAWHRRRAGELRCATKG